jgi:hypothetical protein
MKHGPMSVRLRRAMYCSGGQYGRWGTQIGFSGTMVGGARGSVLAGPWLGGHADRHEARSIRINRRMVRFDLPSQSMAERVRGRARWSVGVAWDGRKHIPYLCGWARGSVGNANDRFFRAHASFLPILCDTIDPLGFLLTCIMASEPFLG